MHVGCTCVCLLGHVPRNKAQLLLTTENRNDVHKCEGVLTLGYFALGRGLRAELIAQAIL